MVTEMKLTGSTNAIADYYVNKENYYFQQAGGAELLADSKLVYLSDQKKNYVEIHGELTPALGFKPGQNISSLELDRMLNGRNAEGKALCRTHKNKGIDLTFSAPKSVSLAHLVTDKDPRILEAQTQAVLETMREIEAHFAYAQPKAGVNVQTGKMAYVLVTDGLSRENDPHLHTHVIIANLTEHDGKVMALRSHKLYDADAVKLIGAVYHGNLAEQYRKIDREMIYGKNGELHDTAVPLNIVRKASKRHDQIVKEKANDKSDQAAFDRTRAKKDPTTDLSERKKSWAQEFAVDGTITSEQTKAEILQDRAAWAKKDEFGIEAIQERNQERGANGELGKWQLAVRRATEHTATVKPEALAAEYINECLWSGEKAPKLSEVLARLEKQVEAGNLVKTKDGRYTSWEMMAAERTYMDYMGTRTNQAAPTAAETEQFLAGYQATAKQQNKKTLSEVQQKAVIEMIATNKRILIVNGSAGAGKTTALRAVAEYYRERDIKVVGLAVAGSAAKNLQNETGIESMTLAAFQKRETNETGRILIIDEASMLSSRAAAKLFNEAEERGDRVILVGDKNQLQSVGAGCAFERMAEDSASAGDLVILDENFRQRNKELRHTVDLARAGKMKDSLTELDKRGEIIEIEKAPARRQAVAQSYNKDTLIIAGSNASRAELNKLIRDRLTAEGELKHGHKYILVAPGKNVDGQEREMKIAEGELITFTKNEYTKYGIMNGERAKVVKCESKMIHVETEDKRMLEIDTEQYKNIDYGYAMTTYKAQGQTFDKVIVESDTRLATLSDMRNQYVNITRARDSARIYTDNKEELKRLAEVKTYSRDTTKDEHSFEAKAKQAELEQRATCGDTMEPKPAQPKTPRSAPAKELQPEPAQSRPAGQKQPAPDHHIEIKNKYLLEQVDGLPDYMQKYNDRMAALTKKLTESKDYTPAQKAKIAEALNSEPGAKVITRYIIADESTTLNAGKALADGGEKALAAYIKEQQAQSRRKGFDMDMQPDTTLSG
jgi:conjugative relaxase-like TrwC/TraI family protein